MWGIFCIFILIFILCPIRPTRKELERELENDNKLKVENKLNKLEIILATNKTLTKEENKLMTELEDYLKKQIEFTCEANMEVGKEAETFFNKANMKEILTNEEYYNNYCFFRKILFNQDKKIVDIYIKHCFKLRGININYHKCEDYIKNDFTKLNLVICTHLLNVRHYKESTLEENIKTLGELKRLEKYLLENEGSYLYYYYYNNTKDLIDALESYVRDKQELERIENEIISKL